MLPKFISKNGGPLTLSESPDVDGPFPEAWIHQVAVWDEGSIRLQYDFSKDDVCILFIQIQVKREDRIQLLTRSSAFSLIFLFCGNCRLSIQNESLILADRGSAGFSGTHDRWACNLQKEISYILILVQYSASFLAREFIKPKNPTGFIYPRPVICTREILDDLAALIFPANFETFEEFFHDEICRCLLVRFTDPYQKRSFQPAGRFLTDHSDFYQLRSQLLKQVTRILDYPDLMDAAGIRDTYHFRKICKQLYGLKPTEYITEARMAHAFTLLKNPALSIKEIALSCGFPGTQYFDRVFLHYFGVTPKALRQR